VSTENTQPTYISNSTLQLELRALRSDVRLWIIGGIALNQFLSSVDIPSAISGSALVGIMVKVFFLGRGVV
jgi:hypothetical protein